MLKVYFSDHSEIIKTFLDEFEGGFRWGENIIPCSNLEFFLC
jgi:hypothetical protein